VSSEHHGLRAACVSQVAGGGAGRCCPLRSRVSVDGLRFFYFLLDFSSATDYWLRFALLMEDSRRSERFLAKGRAQFCSRRLLAVLTARMGPFLNI
jgi:hypothetical protein